MMRGAEGFTRAAITMPAFATRDVGNARVQDREAEALAHLALTRSPAVTRSTQPRNPTQATL
jgi:hypothetical protein